MRASLLSTFKRLSDATGSELDASRADSLLPSRPWTKRAFLARPRAAAVAAAREALSRRRARVSAPPLRFVKCLARADTLLAAAAWLPLGLAGEVLARRLGARSGDDFRFAFAASTHLDPPPLLLLVDRAAETTLRRAGRALRRALALPLLCVAAALWASPGWVRAAAAAALAVASACLAAWLALAPVSWLASWEEGVRRAYVAKAPSGGAPQPRGVSAWRASMAAPLLSERDAVMAGAVAWAALRRSAPPHARALRRAEVSVAGEALRFWRPAVAPASRRFGGGGRETEDIVVIVGAAHCRGICELWAAGGGTVRLARAEDLPG